VDGDISTVPVVLVRALSEPIPLKYTTVASKSFWELDLHMNLLSAPVRKSSGSVAKLQKMLIEAILILNPSLRVRAESEFEVTSVIHSQVDFNGNSLSNCVVADNQTTLEFSPNLVFPGLRVKDAVSANTAGSKIRISDLEKQWSKLIPALKSPQSYTKVIITVVPPQRSSWSSAWCPGLAQAYSGNLQSEPRVGGSTIRPWPATMAIPKANKTNTLIWAIFLLWSFATRFAN